MRYQRFVLANEYKAIRRFFYTVVGPLVELGRKATVEVISGGVLVVASSPSGSR
jgi:hypothetical protein